MHGRISSIHTVASFLNRCHYKKYVGHLGVVPHLEWILTERRNILETDPGVKAAVIHPVVAVVFAEMKRRTKRPAVADHADGSTDQKRVGRKKKEGDGNILCV